MEIETVAATAIGILRPYLAKGGQAFSEKAGEKLAEKAGSLWLAIKTRFASDPDIQAKVDPDARLSTIEEVLIEKMKADSEFATTVNRLVEEVKEVHNRQVISRGDRSIAIGGDSNGAVLIVGDSNQVTK
jgi:hypothetical protein